MSEEKDKNKDKELNDKEIIVKEEKYQIEPKKILVLNYDGSYPLTNEELMRLLGDMENIVNDTDDDYINRILLLPKGFEISELSEEHFLSMWTDEAKTQSLQNVIKVLQEELDNRDNEG